MSSKPIINVSELLGHESSEDCPKCGKKLVINKQGDKWCDGFCLYGWDDDMKEVVGIKTT